MFPIVNNETKGFASDCVAVFSCQSRKQQKERFPPCLASQLAFERMIKWMRQKSSKEKKKKYPQNQDERRAKQYLWMTVDNGAAGEWHFLCFTVIKDGSKQTNKNTKFMVIMAAARGGEECTLVSSGGVWRVGGHRSINTDTCPCNAQMRSTVLIISRRHLTWRLFCF